MCHNDLTLQFGSIEFLDFQFRLNCYMNNHNIEWQITVIRATVTIIQIYLNNNQMNIDIRYALDVIIIIDCFVF